ncbi:MAG: hypothetical protein Q4F76_02915 [Lachnospiraceae bacterium]|nr:hypothetical protein [Lachnospiraceae bacterium]
MEIAELLCVLAGILLFGLMEVMNPEEAMGDGYIQRNTYGQGKNTVGLMIEVPGHSHEAAEITFPVEERQFTREQALAELDALEGRLKEMILGDNPALSQVRTKLQLVSRDSQTGFRIRWSSSRSDIIGFDGSISAEEIDENTGCQVVLKAEISDGLGNSKSCSIPVTVFPPLMSEQERWRSGLLKAIAAEEGRTRTESGFYLPAEYKGETVIYYPKEEHDSIWLLVLGPVMAALLRVRRASEKKNLQKERERKLLLDYSEVISKLQIFLGAGMTVRTAWERIVLDYQRIRERGGEERPAYEEMLQTYYQVQSGTAEGTAYEEFGRRCMLQPYLKLAGLLEQNRRTGTKNLRYLLQIEMTDAFEQRKNLARRQGEEAATKLLVPLFLMLGVVMVIVVVPAFLTFY